MKGKITGRLKQIYDQIVLYQYRLLPKLISGELRVQVYQENDEGQWMTVTTDELVLRHRAYWLNLRGYEETTNQSSVTVQIPESNLFDVEKLRKLMEQSRGGKIQ